jgi:YTH domain-containing family protein
MQKIQNQQQQGSISPSQSPDSAAHSPQLHASTVSQQQQQQQQLQQNMFGLSPTNALAYQMTPMMQLQMQMGMGMGMGMGNTFGMPQTQAMHQSVMRHASPGPPPVDGQGFIGMSGF